MYDFFYVPGDISILARPEVTHTLTIEYLYADDGSTAAPTHNSTHSVGENYSVTSPYIEGYIATRRVVSGTMPDHDVVVTVYYVAVGEGYEIIEDYGTPLGVGAVNINAGDCFE